MAGMLIETELTPNPATRKFLPGRPVSPSGPLDFASPEAAAASPLAEALFDLGDVTGVHFGTDFVSVSAAPGVDWVTLEADVATILLDHFTAAMPLMREDREGNGIKVPAEHDSQFAVDPADADIVAQIEELLDSRVRPAVANDGGDISFRGYEKGHVYLAMHGACAGCPSSTATLKHGVESLLKHYVPEVVAVHAV